MNNEHFLSVKRLGAFAPLYGMSGIFIVFCEKQFSRFRELPKCVCLDFKKSICLNFKRSIFFLWKDFAPLYEMSGIVIVLEWSSFPDLENRQLASREHKVGIKRNITRHERNKDLPSFIYMNLSEIVEKENWGSKFICSPNHHLKMQTLLLWLLGKGPATNSDEFLEKFQRGGGHFQSKSLSCRLWEL